MFHKIEGIYFMSKLDIKPGKKIIYIIHNTPVVSSDITILFLLK